MMFGRCHLSSITGSKTSILVAVVWTFVLDVISGGGQTFPLMTVELIVLEEERTSSQSTHGSEPMHFWRKSQRGHSELSLRFWKC